MTAHTTLFKYLSYLLMIVGGWFLATIRSAGSLDILISQPSIISLLSLLVAWLVGCAAHYAATGSADPVPPADKAPQRLPSPPAPPPAPRA